MRGIELGAPEPLGPATIQVFVVVLHDELGGIRKILGQAQQLQPVARVLGHQVQLRLGERLRLAQQLARQRACRCRGTGPMPTWRIVSAGKLHSLASSMLSTLTLREWNWRLLPSALSDTRCSTISSTDSSCSVMALISSWASLMALRGRDWILPIRLRTWARGLAGTVSRTAAGRGDSAATARCAGLLLLHHLLAGDERLAVPPRGRCPGRGAWGRVSLLSGMMVTSLRPSRRISSISSSLLSLKLENRKGVHATPAAGRRNADLQPVDRDLDSCHGVGHERH